MSLVAATIPMWSAHATEDGGVLLFPIVGWAVTDSVLPMIILEDGSSVRATFMDCFLGILHQGDSPEKFADAAVDRAVAIYGLTPIEALATATD